MPATSLRGVSTNDNSKEYFQKIPERARSRYLLCVYRPLGVRSGLTGRNVTGPTHAQHTPRIDTVPGDQVTFTEGRRLFGPPGHRHGYPSPQRFYDFANTCTRPGENRKLTNFFAPRLLCSARVRHGRNNPVRARSPFSRCYRRSCKSDSDRVVFVKTKRQSVSMSEAEKTRGRKLRFRKKKKRFTPIGSSVLRRL